MGSSDAGRYAAELECGSRNASTEFRDFRALLTSLPGMAYRCWNEPDWPLQFASDGSMALSGYAPGALVGGNPCWGDLIHADDRQQVWETVQDALQLDQRFEIRYRIATADKRCKWVWERGIAVDSDDRGLLIEGFITDITPLRQKEFELERSHQRLNATIEFSPIGITMIDKDLRILAANTAFAAMIGFDTSELIGHRFAEFTHPDDIDNAVQAANRCFTDGPKHYSIRKRYLHKDGHVVHAALSIAVGYDSVGNPEFAVANIEDLTPYLKTEARLKEQQDQLTRLDRLGTLGEMTAGIAHEINQPLTAISTYAQSCLRFMNPDNPKPERLQEALGKLSEQAHRAGAVVERIREFARQRPSDSELIDCNELIEMVEKLAEADARARGVVIRVELARDLSAVLCDPIRIQQVVLNLIRNAIDSIESAGFQQGNEVVLRTEKTGGGGVRIAVVDSGTGVSYAVNEDLFRPFSTDKAAGLGMGLSISRSIVTAHGGQLDYYNNPCGGATFFLSLPPAPGDNNDK